MNSSLGNNSISPTTIIIFGATGDLTKKKLLPALIELNRTGNLPEIFRVVGFSRAELDHGSYRAIMHRAVSPDGDSKDTQLTKFFERWLFQQGLFEDIAAYKKLSTYLSDLDKKLGVHTNKLFYLAVPPAFYEPIFKYLLESGLSKPLDGGEGSVRVLVEKPFGGDLDSAEYLDKKLCEAFADEQIFRIDHYLTKDTTQNILTLRFANVLFENSWSRQYIEKVYIRLSEDFGVEDRGSYYDEVGALRDVGQNHLLQLLALITMDNPGALEAVPLRKARAEMISRMRVYSPKEVSEYVVRGQHAGYQDVPNVASDSQTETYFILKTFIDTERWKDVPFYLESGKLLNETAVEVIVTFKPSSPCVCGDVSLHKYKDIVKIGIKERQEIVVRLWTKKPGLEYTLMSHDLVFDCGAVVSHNSTSAYEKLLHDAFLGDQTLFASNDEVRMAWKVITPIHKHWGKLPLTVYEPGSIGPDSSLKEEAVRS